MPRGRGPILPGSPSLALRIGTQQRSVSPQGKFLSGAASLAAETSAASAPSHGPFSANSLREALNFWQHGEGSWKYLDAVMTTGKEFE